MTAPIEPTPGAPATESSSLFQEPTSTPRAVAPKPSPQRTEPAQSDVEDVSSLPDWAQKLIHDTRGEAAKARLNTKPVKQAAEQARLEVAQQVAKALGIGDDEPVDPAKLTEQIEQAQAEAWRSGVELQIHRMASRLGADAEKLLDSLTFVDSLDDLLEENPRSPEFRKALEAKVQEALDKNPNYKAATGQAPAAPTAPRPDPSQGPRAGAPAPHRGSLTEAIRAHYAQS